MSHPCVETETSGHLLTLRINRPQARNALTRETIRELTAVFSATHNTDSLRCVVLTGAGTEAFCAGADLSELESIPSPEDRRDFFHSVANLIASIRACPVPVIAGVHGFALAGGCGLVAACDIAIAADDAVFGLPEIAIGLAPMVVLAPLRQRVTPAALRLMALRGERFNAERALGAGLVSQVVKKALLEETVKTLCDGIISQGPKAVRATKKALQDVECATLHEQMLDLADRSALVSIGDEAVEGIAAFREKRAPSWKST
jgi:methylglutaconyl-CoA hydratase